MERRVLQAGERCGRYAIEREIGRGGMGIVYLARGPGGEERAIKTLQPAARLRPDLVDRFTREIRLLSYVDHVHVVRFYEAGALDTAHGPMLWVALEHLAGRTMRQIIDGGRSHPEAIARWGKQIAEGLAEVHRLGVVHRDLKPENVCIVGDIAKLFDFGIAKYSDWGNKPTEANRKLGTLPYMSPEQLAGSQTLDARSDIFSLGLVLHELATGKHAFHGDGSGDAADALVRQLTAEAEPLTLLLPGFPADLSQLIERALHHDPAARQSTVTELAEALDAVLRRLFAQRRDSLLGPAAGPGPGSDRTPAPDLQRLSLDGTVVMDHAAPAIAPAAVVAVSSGRARHSVGKVIALAAAAFVASAGGVFGVGKVVLRRASAGEGASASGSAEARASATAPARAASVTATATATASAIAAPSTSEIVATAASSARQWPPSPGPRFASPPAPPAAPASARPAPPPPPPKGPIFKDNNFD